MDIDMSPKELRAASMACKIAAEIAKRRLGKGEYVDLGILLAGFTDKQLDEFIRIMRALEDDFDHPVPSMGVQPNGSLLLDGAHIFPGDRREWRESLGGYGEEKHSQGK